MRYRTLNRPLQTLGAERRYEGVLGLLSAQGFDGHRLDVRAVSVCTSREYRRQLNLTDL